MKSNRNSKSSSLDSSRSQEATLKRFSSVVLHARILCTYHEVRVVEKAILFREKRRGNNTKYRLARLKIQPRGAAVSARSYALSPPLGNAPFSKIQSSARPKRKNNTNLPGVHPFSIPATAESDLALECALNLFRKLNSQLR